MADNPNKLSQFWQELKRRRVVRVMIVYASAAYVIIELVNNVFETLNLPDWTPALTLIILGIGFPLAVIFSWIFDVTAEGIKKTDSIEEESVQAPPSSTIKRWLNVSNVIIAVLVILVGILAYPRVFKSRASLNAMTRPVTVVNELGEKEIRKVFKKGFVSRINIFPFLNEAVDTSITWLQYGLFDAIIMDLTQFNNIVVIGDLSATHLQEQINYAKTNNFPHFLTGTFKLDDEIYTITSRLYQTSNGTVIEKNEFKGSDFFSLIDAMSMQVRIDLGIKKNILNIYPDLPINEQLTKNLDAYRYYVLGNINSLDIKDFKDIIPGSNYINWSKAIELDSTFSIALWRNAYNNDHYQRNHESASKLISQAMRYRSRLAETGELQIQTLYHSIRGEHEKAVALAEMQYDLQPYNYRVLEQLIEVYRQNFMVHEVEKAVQQLNKLVPNLPEYQILLANSYLYAGNLNKGLKVIESVLENNPENTEALMQMGEIYLHKDDLESAEGAYRKAILLSPENEDQWSKLLDHIAYRRNRPITNEFFQSYTGSFKFDRNSEQNIQFFVHNNHLASKPDQQRGVFSYPISDSVFVSHNAWSCDRFQKNDMGKTIRIIHDQINLYFSPIYWKEDSTILKAMDFLNTDNRTKALSAFRIAYDQNPEHYYLSNYIQHLEYIQSPEYEKLKLVYESYTGDYGTQKIFLENDQFYYETFEEFIFKLLPMNEEQFMIPSRINSLVQIENEGDNISGLRIFYRHGEQEFYPRSSEQAFSSQNN